MTSARCGSFLVRNSCAATWSKGSDSFSVVIFIITGAPSIAEFLASSKLPAERDGPNEILRSFGLTDENDRLIAVCNLILMRPACRPELRCNASERERGAQRCHQLIHSATKSRSRQTISTGTR